MKQPFSLRVQGIGLQVSGDFSGSPLPSSHILTHKAWSAASLKLAIGHWVIWALGIMLNMTQVLASDLLRIALWSTNLPGYPDVSWDHLGYESLKTKVLPDESWLIKMQDQACYCIHFMITRPLYQWPLYLQYESTFQSSTYHWHRFVHFMSWDCFDGKSKPWFFPRSIGSFRCQFFIKFPLNHLTPTEIWMLLHIRYKPRYHQESLITLIQMRHGCSLSHDTWICRCSQALPECLPFRNRHRADVAFIVTMAGRIIQMSHGETWRC